MKIIAVHIKKNSLFKILFNHEVKVCVQYNIYLVMYMYLTLCVCVGGCNNDLFPEGGRSFHRNKLGIHQLPSTILFAQIGLVSSTERTSHKTQRIYLLVCPY